MLITTYLIGWQSQVKFDRNNIVNNINLIYLAINYFSFED